jgi:SAM-dependent methyltransferase
VSDAEINNALFIDIDAQALAELVSRKHDMQRGIKKLNTRIFTKLINLTDDFSKTLASLKKINISINSIDVIMCNFAIHYLIGTPDNIRNLINLIKSLLKPGGHFFFTAFDGEKVFYLLKDKDAWDVREGEVLKYSIVKKYKSAALEPVGQQIDVLLPFSQGKYYTEYLVNYAHLLSEFVAGGFIVEKQGSFGSFLPAFKDSNMYDKITKDDAEFLSLYHYAIIKKKA